MGAIAEAPPEVPQAPKNEPPPVNHEEIAAQKARDALLKQRDELKASVDSSSDKNRNFLIAFLGAMLYLAVTIGSTTDKDLLMPASLLELPIVGVKVGLIPFYVLAPALLLLFHLNLLYNLLAHRRRLHELETVEHQIGTKPSPYGIHALLFNNYGRMSGTGVDDLVARILTSASVVVGPFLLFILFEIRFSDYQSLAITTWHLICVFLDLGIIWLFWERICNHELLHDTYSNMGKLLRSTWRQGCVVGWFNNRLLCSTLILVFTCLGTLSLGNYEIYIFGRSTVRLTSDSPLLQWIFFIYGTALSLIALFCKTHRLATILNGLLTVIWCWLVMLLIAKGTQSIPVKDSHPLWAYRIEIIWPSILLLDPLIALLIISIQDRYSTHRQPPNHKPASIITWTTLNAVLFSVATWLILLFVISPTQDNSAHQNQGLSPLPNWLVTSIPKAPNASKTKIPKTELNLVWSLLTGNKLIASHCEGIDWICPRLVVRDEILFSVLDSDQANAVSTMQKAESAENTKDTAISVAKTLPESLIAVDLSDRTLHLADFSRSKLYGAKLTGVKAPGSIWTASALNQANMINATLTGAHMSNATVAASILSQTNLVAIEPANLTGWSYIGVPQRDLKKLKEPDWLALAKKSEAMEDSLDKAIYIERIKAAESRWKQAKDTKSTVTLAKPMETTQFQQMRRTLVCSADKKGVAVARSLFAQQVTSHIADKPDERWHDFVDYCLSRYLKTQCNAVFLELEANDDYKKEMAALDSHCKETFSKPTPTE